MNSKLINRFNQILAFIVLFILIIMPLCLILLKGFVPEGDQTFFDHLKQLGQSYHLKILLNSILLGVSVVILCTLIALPLSYIMTKTTLAKHQWLDLLIMVPFMTPPYIGSMGWMLTMQRNGLLEQISPIFSHMTPYFFSFFGMVLIMSCHLTPFLYIILKNALMNIHQSQEEAAEIYGGTFFYRFKKIIAPLFISGYSMGALLIFVKTIGEFGTPVTMGNRIGFRVLTSEIHHSASIWPIDFQRAALLSTLLLAVSMSVWAFQQWFQTKTNINSSSGKGRKIKIHQSSKWNILCYVYVICELIVTIVLPYASIFANAFMKKMSQGFHLNNFTIQHFIDVLSGNGSIALFNSFLLATISATLASLIGLWVVLITERGNTLGRFIDFTSLLPNTVPGIIVVIGLILFWNNKYNVLPIYNTIAILAVAYTVLYIPYAVQNIKTVNQQISKNLIEAAEISGSKGWTLFRTITLPLLTPGILSGWILIFCISMRELVASLMLRPPNTDTSSTFIYRQFEQGDSAQGMAMALLSIGLTSIILMILEIYQRKKKRIE
ncbi:ABC transporter permease [Staphylococcus sp. Marseille-Q1834]|uniref:ABC transporter permease n=1 Tax=Staphylococcus sp. Marseille-Q1834 TaxID=2866594 RepID=UPI0012B9BB79|nr:iron ABC transporter permease [Staphylococcus sp. Marseille-Q1834]